MIYSGYIKNDIGGFMEFEIRQVSWFITIMINYDITKKDVLILNHLIMKYADYEEMKTFYVKQTTIADELSMQQPNVSRSFKKLQSSGLLVELSPNAYYIRITDLTEG